MYAGEFLISEAMMPTSIGKFSNFNDSSYTNNILNDESIDNESDKGLYYYTNDGNEFAQLFATWAAVVDVADEVLEKLCLKENCR